MRLTINNLVKIFAAVLFIVFVGPSILAIFERPSGKHSYEEHRRKVKHSDGGGPNIGFPPANHHDLSDNNNHAQVELVSCSYIYLSVCKLIMN